MKHLVIVGGGISGLAAAQGARDQAPADSGDLRITVLERDAVVGGKARTIAEDGWLVEAGPTGFLDNEPALDRLVEAAGLQKLPANEAAARRFVVGGGRMREIHAHPLRFAGSGILGPLGMLRILREPWVPRRQSGEDESVWQFAARRLGRQAADRLIAPMVLGVFAGDAKQLSLSAAFPRLDTLEREHGSLIRAMLALKKAKKLSGGPTGPSGTLTSFKQGLDSLPRALAESGQFDVRCDSPVQSIRALSEGGFEIAAAGSGEPVRADAVVLSGEPWAMASLLQEVSPVAAGELDGIDCPPVAVVAFGYGQEALARVPKGFGALISRGEGYRILGCLWDTHLFPGRSADGHLLMRVMLGGSTDTDVGNLSEQELLRVARADVDRLFGWSIAPVYEKAVLWKRAIPQYELGHLQRLERIERALDEVPGLFLCGNALRGVAFTKAAAAGLACGERAAGWLANVSASATCG